MWSHEKAILAINMNRLSTNVINSTPTLSDTDNVTSDNKIEDCILYFISWLVDFQMLDEPKRYWLLSNCYVLINCILVR